MGGFRDAFLPQQWEETKELFEGLKRVEPDLILTHQRADLHQDHRVACELTWNTFRDHLILEYEIPKWDGDLGAPNVFVPLVREVVEPEGRSPHGALRLPAVEALVHAGPLRGMMRIRGMECGSESGFAEAFYGRKLSVVP